MTWEKMTADYLRISVPDVQGLDFIYYLAARRDAYIECLSSTPEGIEYLEEAWRLTLTEPDREAARKHLGGNRVK